MAATLRELKRLHDAIQSGEVTVDQIKADIRPDYDEYVANLAARPPAPQQSNVENMSAFQLMSEGVKGVGEAALSMATAIPAQIAGGYAGMYKAATTDADFISKEVVDTMQDVSGNLTYQPRSFAGQQIMRGIGMAVEPLEQIAESAGTTVTRVTGSPTLGGGVQTLLELGPIGFGSKSPIKPLKNRAAGTVEARRRLDNAGIDPRLPIEQQLNQVPEAAVALAGETTQRAQGLLAVQQATQRAKQAQKNMISEFYREARESGTALVPINEVRILNETMGATLAEGFADANIPAVRNMLDNFVRIIEPSKPSFRGVNVSRRGLGSIRIESRMQTAVMPREQLQKSVVELNDIARLRREASRLARVNNAEVAGAATAIKGNIDNWMNAQFDRDMISGVPDAIDKWRNANTAYREYSNIFNENQYMKNIIENEATPEMVADWIHGANAVGAKSESALVVNRLNKVLGKDSPEMQTVRNSVAFDIVYPILRKNLDQDSITSFQTNYVDFVKKNPSLSEALFDPKQLENFDTLSKIVRSAQKLDNKQGIVPNVDRALAIALFPKAQGLATGSTVLGAATNAVSRLRRIGEPSAKKKVYSDLTGIDMTQPLVRAKDVRTAAYIESAINQGDYWDDIQLMLTETMDIARQQINERSARNRAREVRDR